MNWPVWLNGAHTHYMQTQGRVANALKGVEVLPRAEHPGELPEEPDTNGMTTKDRETAVAEYKLAADRYWRMNSIYAPQKEKLDDGKVQIAQDLLSVRVTFDLKQYLEEQKGADALYTDDVDLPTLCQWIQEACLRVGGRDNREIKKEAKELKQGLDTEGSMYKHETLEDLLHRCKSVQNTFNAAFPSEHDQMGDEDMVEVFHRALDQERFGEYKVYLENKRRQKPRANATQAQVEQFMFFLNLPANLQEIYDECKAYQYCEKPTMSKVMAVEQERRKGKGNGTKAIKPSDKERDSKETRTCYTCGKPGHIAKDCSDNQQNSDDLNSQATPIVQPPPPSVFPIYLPPPWLPQAGHTNMLYPEAGHTNMLYPNAGHYHTLYPNAGHSNMLYQNIGYQNPTTVMTQGYQGSNSLPPQTIMNQSDDDDCSRDEMNFCISEASKIMLPIGEQKHSMMTMMQKNGDNLTYLWDSGASLSLTPYPNDLCDKIQFNEPLRVKTGNGINTSITIRGTCPMFGRFYVHPGIWTRVLSQHQMFTNPDFECRHLTSGEYDVTHRPTGKRFPVRYVNKVLVATVPKQLHDLMKSRVSRA